jgi:hypothetical protein
MTDQDGRTADIRIPFADGETDTMPLDWAERLLRSWRQRDPEGFGWVLAEAATGARPRQPRGRRAAAEGR